MKKNHIKDGFSLIELLVVVAIIGILAAVGTVGYSNYMNSTKERVTASNADSVLSGLKTLAAAKDTGAGCTTFERCLADVMDDITKNPYKSNASSTVVRINQGSNATCTTNEAGTVYVASTSNSTGGTVTVSYCYLADGKNATLKALPSFEFGDN